MRSKKKVSGLRMTNRKEKNVNMMTVMFIEVGDEGNDHYYYDDFDDVNNDDR